MNTAKHITTSTNLSFTGKPVKKICQNTGKSYLDYHGTAVNLANNWTQVSGDWTDIFEIVAVHGYPIAPPLFKNDYRTSDHFIASQLVMVDVDRGMTLQELANDELYNQYGAGFYTTASHTDLEHRFRIIFLLEHPITDPDDFIKLNAGLISHYDGDKACKDPARLFYGSINAVQAECKSNVLSSDIFTGIIDIMREEEAQRQRNIVTIHEQYRSQCLRDSDKQVIIELLRGAFIGDYVVWRSIAWAMKNSGFKLEDFIYVTSGMMNKKSAEDAKRVWLKGIKHTNKLTMGTILYTLFAYYGKEQVLSQIKLHTIEEQLTKMRQSLAHLQKSWKGSISEE